MKIFTIERQLKKAWFIAQQWWKISAREPIDFKMLNAFYISLCKIPENRDLNNHELYDLVNILFSKNPVTKCFLYLELQKEIGSCRLNAIEKLKKSGLFCQKNFDAMLQHPDPDALASAIQRMSKVNNDILELSLEHIYSNPHPIRAAKIVINWQKFYKNTITPTNLNFVLHHPFMENIANIVSYLSTAKIDTVENLKQIELIANKTDLEDIESGFIDLNVEKIFLSQEQFDIFIQREERLAYVGVLICSNSQMKKIPYTQNIGKSFINQSIFYDPQDSLKMEVSIVMNRNEISLDQVKEMHFK